MKKWYKSLIAKYFVLLVMYSTTLSAMPTLWPNKSLSSQIKEEAIQFKMLQGSNRISEFNKLYEGLFSHLNQATNYSVDDIKKILGNEYENDNNGNMIYYISYNKEKKATFTYNKYNQITGCAVSLLK